MIISELNAAMLKVREEGKIEEFHLLARAHATICRLTMAIRVDDDLKFSNEVFADMENDGLFAYADEVILQSERSIRKFGV